MKPLNNEREQLQKEVFDAVDNVLYGRECLEVGVLCRKVENLCRMKKYKYSSVASQKKRSKSVTIVPLESVCKSLYRHLFACIQSYLDSVSLETDFYSFFTAFKEKAQYLGVAFQFLEGLMPRSRCISTYTERMMAKTVFCSGPTSTYFLKQWERDLEAFRNGQEVPISQLYEILCLININGLVIGGKCIDEMVCANAESFYNENTIPVDKHFVNKLEHYLVAETELNKIIQPRDTKFNVRIVSDDVRIIILNRCVLNNPTLGQAVSHLLDSGDLVSLKKIYQVFISAKKEKNIIDIITPWVSLRLANSDVKGFLDLVMFFLEDLTHSLGMRARDFELLIIKHLNNDIVDAFVKYVDRQFKRGNMNERIFKAACHLFVLLGDRKINFYQKYMDLLSKRLIKTPTRIKDTDYEFKFIQNILNDIGSQIIDSMAMLKDITYSLDNFSTEKFTGLLCTKSKWPEQPSSYVVQNLPSELQTMIGEFESHAHELHKSNVGMRIEQAYNLHIFNMKYGETNIDSLNIIQALALLHLNEHPSVNETDLQEYTSSNQIKRSLDSLCTSGVLDKQNEAYVVNISKKHIVVQHSRPAASNKPYESRVSNEIRIQAFIVRILKREKLVEHNHLRQLVDESIPGTSVGSFKASIEKLLGMDYLKRNGTSYEYVA